MATLTIHGKREQFCAKTLFGSIGDCAPPPPTTSTSLVDINNLMDITINYVQHNSQKLSATSTITQTMNVEISGTLDGNCQINIPQSITATSTVSGTLNTAQLSDLSTMLISNIMQQLDQSANAHSGWFATSEASAQNLSNFKSNLSTIISSSLSSNAWQEYVNSVVIDQNKTIKLTNFSCTNNAKLNAGQDIVSVMVTQAWMNSIQGQVINAEQALSANLRQNQQATSGSGGLDTVIKSITDMASNPIFLGLCIVCLLMIVAIIVLKVMSKKGGGGGGHGNSGSGNGNN